MLAPIAPAIASIVIFVSFSTLNFIHFINKFLRFVVLFSFYLFSLNSSGCPLENVLAQWPSMEVAQTRFPGCCGPEYFDCKVAGGGTCISISKFHDGVADCSDGSDESCFPGQIKCGKFCADIIHFGECLRNPYCNPLPSINTTVSHVLFPIKPTQPSFCPLLKRKLCGLNGVVSCKGYGECILFKWLMDGKRDCLDGSDEDPTYARLFQVIAYVGPQITPSGPINLNELNPVPAITSSPPRFVQLIPINNIPPISPTVAIIPINNDNKLKNSNTLIYDGEQFTTPTTQIPTNPFLNNNNNNNFTTKNGTTVDSGYFKRITEDYLPEDKRYGNNFHSTKPIDKISTTTTQKNFEKEIPTIETTDGSQKPWKGQIIDDFGLPFGPSTKTFSSSRKLNPQITTTIMPFINLSQPSVAVGRPSQDGWIVFPNDDVDSVTPTDGIFNSNINILKSPFQPSAPDNIIAGLSSNRSILGWIIWPSKQAMEKDKLEIPADSEWHPGLPLDAFYPVIEHTSETSIISTTMEEGTSKLTKNITSKNDSNKYLNQNSNKTITTTITSSTTNFEKLTPINTTQNISWTHLTTHSNNTTKLSQILNISSEYFHKTINPMNLTESFLHKSTESSSIANATTPCPVGRSNYLPICPPWNKKCFQSLKPVIPIISDNTTPKNPFPLDTEATILPITPLTTEIQPEIWIPEHPETTTKDSNFFEKYSKQYTSNIATTTFLPDYTSNIATTTFLPDYPNISNLPAQIFPFVVPAQVWIPENPKMETTNTNTTTTTTTTTKTTIENSTMTTTNTTTTMPIKTTMTNIFEDIVSSSSNSSKNFTIHILNITSTTLATILNFTESLEPLNSTLNSGKYIENLLTITTTQINGNNTKIPTTLNQTLLPSEFPLDNTKVAIWPQAIDLISYNNNSTKITSLKALNCTQKYKKMASDLVPKFLCDCDAGKLRDVNGNCIPVNVATFRARISKLCGVRAHDFLTSDFEAKIIQMKLSATLNYPICVREINGIIILNTECGGNCSTFTQLSEQYTKKSSEILPEVLIKLNELEKAGCYQFNLNDCDNEKAECIPVGVHYHCSCLPGTNDTDGTGRNCSGVVISQVCTQIFGVCVLVWIMLLLLLCFLIPILLYFWFAYCQQQNDCLEQFTELKEKFMNKFFRHPESQIDVEAFRANEPIIVINSPSPQIASNVNPLSIPFTNRTIEPRRESVPSKPPVAVLDTLAVIEPQQKAETLITINETPENTKDYYIVENSVESEEKAQSLSSVEISICSSEYAPAPVTTIAQQPSENEDKNAITKIVPLNIPVERPPSIQSRTATPTIWETYQILGNQYTRFGSGKRRKSSTQSLEELLQKSQNNEFKKTKIEQKRHSYPEHEIVMEESNLQPTTNEAINLQTTTIISSSSQEFLSSSSTASPKANNHRTQIDPNILSKAAIKAKSQRKNSLLSIPPIPDIGSRIAEEIPSVPPPSSSTTSVIIATRQDSLNADTAFGININVEHSTLKKPESVIEEPSTSSKIFSKVSEISTATLQPFVSSIVDRVTTVKEPSKDPKNNMINHYRKPPPLSRTKNVKSSNPDDMDIGSIKSRIATRRSLLKNQKHIQSKSISTSKTSITTSSGNSFNGNLPPIPVQRSKKIPLSGEIISPSPSKRKTYSNKTTTTINLDNVTSHRPNIRSTPAVTKPPLSGNILPISGNRQLSKISEKSSEAIKRIRGISNNLSFNNGSTFERRDQQRRGAPTSTSETSSAKDQKRTTASSKFKGDVEHLPKLKNLSNSLSSQESFLSKNNNNNNNNNELPPINLPMNDNLELNFIPADIDLDLPGPYLLTATAQDMAKFRRNEKNGKESLSDKKAKTIIKSTNKKQRKLSITSIDAQRSKISIKSTPKEELFHHSKKLAIEKLNSARSEAEDILQSARSNISQAIESIEERVHSNCIIDRDQWDRSPIREGELEKIPLDWNAPGLLKQQRCLEASLEESDDGIRRSRSSGDMKFQKRLYYFDPSKTTSSFRDSSSSRINQRKRQPTFSQRGPPRIMHVTFDENSIELTEKSRSMVDLHHRNLLPIVTEVVSTPWIKEEQKNGFKPFDSKSWLDYD